MWVNQYDASSYDGYCGMRTYWIHKVKGLYIASQDYNGEDVLTAKTLKEMSLKLAKHVPIKNPRSIY